MTDRIAQLQTLVRASDNLHINTEWLDYSGVVEYYPGELEKTEEFGTDILKLSVDMGGTITGEHGVGVEKLNVMCHQFNSKELEIFHKIKQAFDPDSLLNPGKAVPELHRCAELGAMHVHNGKLPHPELERF